MLQVFKRAIWMETRRCRHLFLHEEFLGEGAGKTLSRKLNYSKNESNELISK